MRYFFILLLLTSEIALCRMSFAQESDALSQAAVCTFSDDKQMTIRYTPVNYDKKNGPPFGKAWSPGGTPMALFTEAALVLNNKDIPTAAYNVYLLPDKNNWTLIVSKNVTPGAAYDESQDLVRAPMEMEKLPEMQKTLSMYFGHIAPKKCSLRLDFGMQRMTVEFGEQ
jgi:hypothetical protein